jgi:hypothetical protein
VSGTTTTDRGAGARRLDFFCALLLAAVSLAAILWIIPAHVPGAASRGEVAPSFFPNLTAGVVLVCAVALAIANAGAVLQRAPTGGPVILVEIAGWTVVAAAIWYLLAHVGFIAASVFATAAGTLVARYRRLWFSILTALILPFVLQFAVQALFGIALP